MKEDNADCNSQLVHAQRYFAWLIFFESDLPAEVMLRDRVLFADAGELCHQDLT
jgi:hypothetical protein